jgi:hypothetical protein
MIWPEWMASWRLGILWTVVTLGALVSVFYNLSQGLMRRVRLSTGCPDSALREAQRMYLAANYFDAEQILTPYCNGRDTDVEAALLLASILRRTSRFSQAEALLDRLERLERSQGWAEEIAREKNKGMLQRVHAHADSMHLATGEQASQEIR